MKESKQLSQQTNLLFGTKQAYKNFESKFSNFSFRLAYKGSPNCGTEWFRNPDKMTKLFAIAVVENNGIDKVYKIISTNPEWTEFSKPILIGDGPWLGTAGYNPFEIDFTENESFETLQNYLLKKGYSEVGYTQVSLLKIVYPPFQMSYGYDLDLSKYGFKLTQFVTAHKNGDVDQTNEMGYCPLPH